MGRSYTYRISNTTVARIPHRLLGRFKPDPKVAVWDISQ